MKKISILFFLLSSFFFSLPSSLLHAQSYSKGEKVEILSQGSWYKGNIEQVMKENSYKVHFSGYWASREEIVTPDRLRPIRERGRPNPADLKSGESIEFLEGDHWRVATFVESDGSKVLVRFTEGEKQKEKWIPAKHLSLVPGSSAK